MPDGFGMPAGAGFDAVRSVGACCIKVGWIELFGSSWDVLCWSCLGSVAGVGVGLG